MKFIKKQYYHNFEDLLQSEAEEFIVYPSDKVWNNVRKELHPQKKWTALLIVFVFILASLITISSRFYPKENHQTLAFRLSNNSNKNKIEFSNKSTTPCQINDFKKPIEIYTDKHLAKNNFKPISKNSVKNHQNHFENNEIY